MSPATSSARPARPGLALLALALLALALLAGPAQAQEVAALSPPSDVSFTLTAQGMRVEWTQSSPANFVFLTRIRGDEQRDVAGWWGTFAPLHVALDERYQPGDRYVIREGLLALPPDQAVHGPYDPPAAPPTAPGLLFLPLLAR